MGSKTKIKIRVERDLGPDRDQSRPSRFFRSRVPVFASPVPFSSPESRSQVPTGTGTKNAPLKMDFFPEKFSKFLSIYYKFFQKISRKIRKHFKSMVFYFLDFSFKVISIFMIFYPKKFANNNKFFPFFWRICLNLV